MTTDHDAAQKLQLKMNELRGRIEEESEEAADQTRRALDWKHQVASHPLVAASIAIAVGYWLIPQPRNVSSANSLEEIRTLLENQPRQPAAGSGMGKTLALAAATVLTRGLASGGVSKAFAALEGWRERSPSTISTSFAKHNVNPVNEGKPNDE